MLNRSIKFLLITSCVVAFGCLPKIKHFDKYQKAEMPKTDIMPTEDQLKKSIPSVVVLALDDEADSSKKANLGLYLSNSIQDALVSAKLVSIVSRDKAGKLSEEIKLAEMSSSKSISIPTNANYAITGSVTLTDLSSTMVSQSSDNGGGALGIIASQINKKYYYLYTANVSSNIKVYELPSLKLISSSTFDGEAKRQDQAKVDGNIINKKIEDAKTYDASLFKEAAKNAITKNISTLKDVFARTGYVVEKRTFDGKIIFKITLGKNDGIKHGDNVTVFQSAIVKDELTNRTNVDVVQLGIARISDIISSEYSWIVIDAEIANKVKLGDAVKIYYTKR